MQLIVKSTNSGLDKLVSWKFNSNSKKLRGEKVALVSKLGQKLDKLRQTDPHAKVESQKKPAISQEASLVQEEVDQGASTTSVGGISFGAASQVAPEEETQDQGDDDGAVLPALTDENKFPIKILEKEVVASVMRTPTKYQSLNG